MLSDPWRIVPRGKARSFTPSRCLHHCDDVHVHVDYANIFVVDTFASGVIIGYYLGQNHIGYYFGLLVTNLNCASKYLPTPL